jgi:hypothetical protein
VTDTPQLKDPSLFISDAFIDGQWVSKDKKFDVFGMQCHLHLAALTV